MKNGFFNLLDDKQSNRRPSLVPKCGACGFYRYCKNPKIPFQGKGKKRILLVSECPSDDEDSIGVHLTGTKLDKLTSVLSGSDIDLDNDCWLTSALICKPTKKKGLEDAIEWCKPNIIKTIQELKPNVIILMGSMAVKSVIGWAWKPNIGMPSRWDGWQIPSQKLNAWICPTWAIDDVIDIGYGSGKENEVRELFFKQHIKKALSLSIKPWPEGSPNWNKRIKVVMNPKEAAEHIQIMLTEDTPLAIDYETDRLKPDHKDASIITCAVSNEELSIAFPWHGEAIRAMERLMEADVPKIASNMKFEQRWTIKEFGHPGNNWRWDTMLAAHILDNRPDITGIEFQSFVLLGQEPWDDGIDWGKMESCNSENRIRRMPLDRILKYNGWDSFLEWKVAEIQSKQMRIEI